MHDHHNHCTHELRACEKCDVVFCTRCRKEWGAVCRLNHYPNYWWGGTTYSYPGVSITSQSGNDITASATVCSHTGT